MEVVKPFLLIANPEYYPRSGTSDWVGCFKTEEEATKSVIKTKRRYEPYDIVVDGHIVRQCNSFSVVDLRNWISEN